MHLKSVITGVVLATILITLVYLNNIASQEAHQPAGQQGETNEATAIEPAEPNEGGLVARSNETEEPGPADEAGLLIKDSVDTDFILDDYQIAVWINVRKLLKSQFTDRFIKLASQNALSPNPLDDLKLTTGMDAAFVKSALFLSSVPKTPVTTSSQDQIEVDVTLPPDSESTDESEQEATEETSIEEEIIGDSALAQETELPEGTAEPLEEVEIYSESAQPDVKYGAIITFTKAIDLNPIVGKITTDQSFDFFDNEPVSDPVPGTKVQYNGVTYTRGAGMKPSVCIYDETTLLVASEDQLKAMIDKKGGNGKLASTVGNIKQDNTFAFCANFRNGITLPPTENFSPAGLAGPQFQVLFDLIRKVSSATLILNPDSDTPVSLQVAGQDDKATKDVFMQINMLATLAKVMLPAQIQQFESNPNAEPEMVQLLTTGAELAKNLSVTNEGDQVNVLLTWNDSLRTKLLDMFTLGLGNARGSARKMQSKNNMKQIGIAVYNYEFTHRGLPTGEIDGIKYAEGTPLLSWRVHILPFIEEQALYERFHLDEPWNSEHNIQLLEEIPPVYQHPNYKDLKGKTVYRVPAGDSSVLGSNKPVGLRDIQDGTSQTAMVIEVGQDKAIEWTKPEPLPVDLQDVVSSFGELKKAVTVLLADGAVLDLPQSMDNTTWKGLLSRNGGEILELPR